MRTEDGFHLKTTQASVDRWRLWGRGVEEGPCVWKIVDGELKTRVIIAQGFKNERVNHDLVLPVRGSVSMEVEQEPLAWSSRRSLASVSDLQRFYCDDLSVFWENNFFFYFFQT